MVVAGFSMHLYCDCDNPAHTYGEFPHEVDAETRGQCTRIARRAGWVFQKDGQVRCPKCKNRAASRERTFDAANPPRTD